VAKRVVVLGGGGGAALSLAAIDDAHQRTAVIAVTDTGRSTGVARQLGGDMPAPGDIRATIAATAANQTVARLLQHRFVRPGVRELDGMALGNLMIAALYRETGDFAVAVQQMNRLAETNVAVLPVTAQQTQLMATLVDGHVCVGEVAVREPNKPAIAQCALTEDVAALPDAVSAILQADVVVIGPGSFYTTLHAVLLPKGIREALHQTAAHVIFVMNTTSQTGQTEHLRLIDHIRVMHEFVGPGVIDLTLVNTAAVSDTQAEQLSREGLHQLTTTPAEQQQLADAGIRCHYGALIERAPSARALWNKQDTVRHDRIALQQIFRQFLA